MSVDGPPADRDEAVARALDASEVVDPGHPRRVAIFAVVATALMMSTIDGTVVATALHAIHLGLHASLNWTSWTITAYSVGLVLSLSLAGRLSMRFGRRRFFVISVIVFSATSLCCGLATNIYELIVLRAIQAAGGAGFTPSATGIIVDNFGSARDKAVGLFGSIFPVGSLIGPIFGGIFVTYWTWRGIFFINVPIGAVLVVACLRVVPKDAKRLTEQRRPTDLSGMALLGFGMLAFMLAISLLGEKGARILSAPFLISALVALIGLGQFARHIRRVSDPFIEPHLIAGKSFGPVNLVNIVFGGGTTGLLTLVPLYALNRYHISQLGSSTLLTADGAAAIVVSILASMALRRTGYRKPIYAGALLLALCMAGLFVRPLGGLSPYAWLAIAACVGGMGSGLSSPASRNAGLQLAPQQSSSIAALRTTGRQVGSILVISITTAFLAQSNTPGEVQSKVYLASAVLLVLALPIISRIPEHRGSW